MGQRDESGSARLALILLALGILLQFWLWSRPVWLYRDQVELYTLGLDFARDGKLDAFGKLMTGDYTIPGVFLQLLVGVPLMLWRDARAPTLLMGLTQVAAAVLFARVLRRELDGRASALFLAVFWLSPWRLYHSGFLWEANFLFLPAAVHLWACRELRSEARVWPSLALGLTFLLTAQVHAAILILALATLFLLWRRRLVIEPRAALAGAFLGSITLWPTLAALLAGRRPETAGEAAAGLLTRLNSVEKGLVYWIRFGSPDVGRRFRETVFCALPGGREGSGIACGAIELTEAVALVGVVLSLVASWWFWRRREASEREPEGWLRDYALAVLAGVVVAAALSPVLVQGWHLLIAMPAACLPVALWLRAAWSPGKPRFHAWLRAAMVVTVLWRLPAVVLLGLGHPMYVKPEDPAQRMHVAPEALRELLR